MSTAEVLEESGSVEGGTTCEEVSDGGCVEVGDGVADAGAVAVGVSGSTGDAAVSTANFGSAHPKTKKSRKTLTDTAARRLLELLLKFLLE